MTTFGGQHGGGAAQSAIARARPAIARVPPGGVDLGAFRFVRHDVTEPMLQWTYREAIAPREYAYDVTCVTCGEPVILRCWEELVWAAVLEHRHATEGAEP